MFHSLCFTYTGSVSISYFLISEGWEGFTIPSNPWKGKKNWSNNQSISNSNTVFSSFILDSDFGFKYFLELVCTKKNPIVLNYTWNDDNVLVWGQKANPVANQKSEYIREGYALRKSLKGLRYMKQKKENWMFCKFHKENLRKLENCTTSIVCVNYESDLQLK